MKACEGEMVWFGSRSPSLFIDRVARGEMQKYPGFSHSFDMWKMAIIGRRSQGAQHLSKARHYSTSIWNLEKNPPRNAEDNLSAGLVVIEAWFRGYRGSPGLGGVRVAGLYLQPDSRTMKIQD